MSIKVTDKDINKLIKYIEEDIARPPREGWTKHKGRHNEVLVYDDFYLSYASNEFMKKNDADRGLPTSDLDSANPETALFFLLKKRVERTLT